jgi:hypothetical protein
MSQERIDIKIWDRYDSIILQQVRRQSLAYGPAWQVVWDSVWVNDRVWSHVGLQVWHGVWLPVRDQTKEEHNG